MIKHRLIKDRLCEIGEVVCGQVHQSLVQQSLEERSAVYAESEDDTIYQLDRDVEVILLPLLEKLSRECGGLVVVAEGIDAENETCVFPPGTREEDAAVRVLIDPIDGTRGIMYDKRSAFFLAGAAPNRGTGTRLSDIEVAVMVELPTSRSHLSDTFSAIRGEGAFCYTRNIATGQKTKRTTTPSTHHSILGGFAQISRFFPPGKTLLADIEETMVAELFPDAPEGRAILFEDQYISTGGQLNELLVGHDRFTADLRTIVFERLKKEGQTTGLTCHPYDLSSVLIGIEAGLVITGADGEPLDAPMDTTSPVDWICYANKHIQAEIEPVLQRLLKERDLL